MAELSPLRAFDFREEASSVNNLSFSRKSEASFYGADGYLHFDQPGTNLLTDSEDFTNYNWTRVGSKVTIPGNISTVNGSQSGNRITEEDGSGEHRLSRGVNVNQGELLTISIYLKAGTRNKVQFGFMNGSAFKGGNPAVKFNLATGTFISTSSNVVSYQAVNSGNGWWRLKVTGIPDLGSSTGLHVYLLDDYNKISYQGSTGKYLHAWGAQFERGSNLTTYTPSTLASSFGLRYNYDLSGAPVLIGALIENSATNLIPYSQGLDNAAWRKQYATVVASGSRSPEGTINAYKIKESSDTSSHYIIPQQNPSTSSGSTYTFSAFLKASERKWAYFNINGSTVHFDLANGEIGNQSYVYKSAAIESAGNGWYRCSATFTANSSSSSTKIGPEPGNGVPSYNGDGNSGILIWGVQLEKGDKMTSYIRTKAGTASRSADLVTLEKPSSAGANDIFVQRKEGGEWLVNYTDDFQVTSSEDVVQVVNFYSPNQPVTLKDQTVQELFPQDYEYVGDSGIRVFIFGNEFNTQTPNKPWSLQQAINKTSPTFRFQVNSGDTWIGDINSAKKKERSEFYHKNANLPYNQDIWLSYAIKIIPGAALDLTASQACFLGQFHASEDSKDISSGPVLGFRLEGADTIRAYTCSTTDNPHTISPRPVLRGTGTFTRGVWHKVVVRARFSPTNGQFQWWLNGKQLVNLSGIGMGYPDASGPYWKFGIYRNAIPPTLSVEYANMEISENSSLYARVAKPLPIV